MQSNGKKTTLPNIFEAFFDIFWALFRTLFVISNLRRKYFSKNLITQYLACIYNIGMGGDERRETRDERRETKDERRELAQFDNGK